MGISAHLQRNLFSEGSALHLSPVATEWLVSMADVMNVQRASGEGSAEPGEQVWLYKRGERASACTMVSQGRLAVQVGYDEFSTEAGAFKILGKECLSENNYTPDFSASVCTEMLRYMSFSKTCFERAKALDEDEDSLIRQCRTFASSPRSAKQPQPFQVSSNGLKTP